ncbi:helix-turn-helix domain-containing protein [Lentzea jiangxiensis]|uniref:Helix-turn-helix domain-containing protein n=1 Tax=Lentzea jiangxiensis TaxID=641025 RepID=A0A1H0WTT3_9PSEU|nr:helix-turn-helix transcriptional regulator [Lentzea jiangxiensis]SDP93999.1 Helix-turn-helix domain-containing protein [Lentzea jiangxiensis]
MPKGISTARGRELGEGLTRALKRADLRGRSAAAIAGWDPSKISNLANGKGGASTQEVAFLLGACRVQPDERDHLLALHSDVDARGWWQQHGSYCPIEIRTLAEHLEIAKSVVTWQNHVVPYALRTPRYMRAVVLASANIPAEEADERAHAQARARTTGTYYIHESALLLPVGSPDIQAEQLKLLLDFIDAADVAGIVIRILPVAAGAHAGLNGPFTKLDFEKCEPMVCLESETSALFVEDPAAVKGYDRIVEALDNCSLDVESSKWAIKRILATFKGSEPSNIDAGSIETRG